MPDRISITEYRELVGQRPPAPKQERREAAAYQQTAPEAAIQAAICEWLDLRLIPYSVTDASRVFGRDGQPRRSKVNKSWPDISGVLPPSGRALYIECKSATGRFQPGQKQMLARLRAAGALVIVARSLDDVISEIGQASR